MGCLLTFWVLSRMRTFSVRVIWYGKGWFFFADKTIIANVRTTVGMVQESLTKACQLRRLTHGFGDGFFIH